MHYGLGIRPTSGTPSVPPDSFAARILNAIPVLPSRRTGVGKQKGSTGYSSVVSAAKRSRDRSPRVLNVHSQVQTTGGAAS